MPKIIFQKLSFHPNDLKFFYYFHLVCYLKADYFAVVQRLFYHQSFFRPSLWQYLLIVIVNLTCIPLLITDRERISYRFSDADLAHRDQLNRGYSLPIQIMRLQCPFTFNRVNRQTFLALISVFDKESVLVVVVGEELHIFLDLSDVGCAQFYKILSQLSS